MGWPVSRRHLQGKSPIIFLVVGVATLVVLVLLDVVLGDVPRTDLRNGKDTVTGIGVVMLLVVGGVAGWSLIRAMTDGRETRRRRDPDA